MTNPCTDPTDYGNAVRCAPNIWEALYQLDRLVAAKMPGARPFDTLSAMSARGELAHAAPWHALARVLDFISPHHAEMAAVDQARREAQCCDDHIPITIEGAQA